MRLAAGAHIAIVAPSGAFDPARLESGRAVLHGWGYRTTLLPGASQRHRYLAGPDEVRLADLHEAFRDPRYDAVWMARGGYGLARILDRVRWDELRPIPFFGFSDGTAFLNAAEARGRPVVHAPVVTSLATEGPPHLDQASRDHLRRVLAGEVPTLTGRVLVPGRAEGPLVGGNVCVLASLCGTRLQLRSRGAVVLLEDVGEVPYKLDRLLTQLIAAGAFDGAAGFVLGDFVGAEPAADAGWTLDDLLRDLLGPLGAPVLAGLPVGHGPRNHALPFRRVHLVGAELRPDDLRPGDGFPVLEPARA